MGIRSRSLSGPREHGTARARLGGCPTMISPPLLALQPIFSSRVVSVEDPSQPARDAKKPGKEVLTTMP